MRGLATPYLLIDGLIVVRNVERLAIYADQYELAVRPHVKTHKSELIARLQIEAGAYALTVAKVGEAEVMSRAADDLLIAFPAVDRERTRRIARLAMHKTIRVAIDSKEALDALATAARAAATTIGILVDLDVGFHRTGVQSPGAALVLAELVDKTAGLRLDGLFCYPGHVWVLPEAQEPLLAELSDLLLETLDLWAEHGLEAGIISGGSTPTAYQSHLVPELNEIRPGTYVFNDVNTWRGGFCTLDDCAARVVATVVSNSVGGQIVLDAGSKTLSSEPCRPIPQSGYGYLIGYPDAIIRTLTEEHAQVDVTASRRVPKVGERVEIIPNHICTCVNLHDQLYWKDADAKIIAMPIDARGKVS